METLLEDIRYAWRTLSKSPAFASIAILTLALGIGANTAIFSVLEGVVLAPLPYREPSRLVLLLESNKRFPKDAISYPNFQDWQKESRSFQEMAAIRIEQGFDMTAPGPAEHLNGDRISSGFFRTLGESLVLGREFSPEKDRPGGAPAVLISSRRWKVRYASNPGILGQSMSLDGVDRVIIGVAPLESLIDDHSADVYTPLAQDDPLTLNSRANHDSLVAIARLKPGVAIKQARAEMSMIQDRWDRLYPDADSGLGAEVLALKEEPVGDSRTTLLLLLCAVGLVFLITCANIASLLLARSRRRSREFAIRAAHGASRIRVVRQWVTESLILSLSGGALGAEKADVFRMVIGGGLRLALAGAVIGGMGSLVLGQLVLSFSHLLYGVHVSDPATFAVATAMLTGVATLACYIPARRATRVDPMAALRQE
jgi:predicted permease